MRLPLFFDPVWYHASAIIATPPPLGQRHFRHRDHSRESPEPRMTLQQLRDFIAVIEHGGFRAAARPLNVSQGGLTKSLARLEDDPGVCQLARDAKGLAPTDTGEAFLHLAPVTVPRRRDAHR